MFLIIYSIVAALFVFCMYRWEYIDDLIEARKPNYEYIEWLERKALEAPRSNLHSFWGLEQGLGNLFAVAGCQHCSVAYDSEEVYPCQTHVALFKD